ncbi:MAG TPA: DUF5686 family protein [Puia sp.]|nr:DUF5686 family protein [Puia sp.]
MSQTKSIIGIVEDAISKQPLSLVSVAVKNGRGVTTDSLGYFAIETDKLPVQLSFSIIGYKNQSLTVKQFNNDSLARDTLIVLMQANSSLLGSVTVKSKKKPKYRNKDNPAVELIRKVINNKEKNRPGHYDYVEYEQYEKLQVALSKFSDKLANSKLLRKYHFLFENIDSTKLEGKSLIPVYMEEKLADIYYRKSPVKKKTLILGDKQVNFGEFIDNKGVSTFLNRLYEDVDIYNNNIPLFTNEFISPIADIAPSLYRFYIRDTIRDEQGNKFVRMYFTPRNVNDFLFRGEMMVTLDSNYAIQKLNMYISPNINLNFVREMHIDQDFERDEEGRYRVIKSNLMAEAALNKEKGGGFFGERMVSFKNYKINHAQNPDFYKGPAEVTLDSAANRDDGYWSNHRHDSLTRSEAKVYKNIDSLQNMPSYRRFMDIATLLLAGYKSFGKFEVGPVNTFYSFNPVEGFRARLGGRTTAKLSKRLYFETYAAYGFKDMQYKGYLGVTYSLNNKSIYEYPLNYIRASAQRETKIPGQELQFVQEDNFLLSFKRGDNDKWLYNNFYRLDYVHEFSNHFSYTVGFKNWRQEPAGGLQYFKEDNGSLVNVPALTTTELSAELRWAPNEQFYQGKVYRIPIVNQYPIFTMRYTKGIKGSFGGEYDYSNLVLRMEKRFYLSSLGYADMVFEGGYLFNQLPYPLQFIHRANQTYSYQINSYNLMNFLEFVSDHYVSVNIDQHFNGFIFNRIPLLRKLKLREVMAVKVLYGAVRSENDPRKNPGLYEYPTDKNGEPITFALDHGPYIEASVGIANIFKLFRIDLVKRFTYLNHPDVSEWGVRGRFKFDF